MLDDLFPDRKTVAEFASEIFEHIQAANKNWYNVAKTFAEAREAYGAESIKFKELIKITGFSKSKVSKLIKIATSERLRVHAEQLATIHSWGTLYEIDTLDEDQFQKLKQIYNLDDGKPPQHTISQNAVSSLKKIAPDKPVMKTFAVIQFDPSADKNGLIPQKAFDCLAGLLLEISDLDPHISVDWNDELNDEYMKNELRLERKATQIARRYYDDEIERRISSSPSNFAEKLSQKVIRLFGASREELKMDFNADMRSAFAKIGLEFNWPHYIRKAEDEMTDAAAKLGKAA